MEPGPLRVPPVRRGHPHRRRTACPNSPARPALDSTRAAAAATRSPPTCVTWCKRELTETARGLYDLQQVLLTRAIEAGGTYLPGYTHLQRAQPVLLAHHLLAHGWALGRDIDRLLATVDRLDVSPLGAGALAGTSLRSTRPATRPISASRVPSRTRSTP
ncbi:MAG: lyase family protein [Ilumatobacteraceae bacterium]